MKKQDKTNHSQVKQNKTTLRRKRCQKLLFSRPKCLPDKPDNKTREQELKVKIVGNNSWEGFRDMIVSHLSLCKTEDGFKQIMVGIGLSVGTIEQMKERRKIIGLKKYTKDELKEILK